MHNIFSELGGDAWDFVQISVSFMLTMLLFFGIRKKKYFWLNYLSLVTLMLQCFLLLLFRNGLPIKLFAALMLMTTLIVETVTHWRRKLRTVP